MSLSCESYVIFFLVGSDGLRCLTQTGRFSGPKNHGGWRQLPDQAIASHCGIRSCQVEKLDDGWPESVEEQGLLLLIWRHHIRNKILKMCYMQSRRGVLRQKFLHTDAFTYRPFYAQTLLHTKLLPTEVFTYRSFYTHTLAHRCFYTQTLLHWHFYTQSFYSQKLLHTEAFTNIRFYTDVFTHRHFYTQTLVHTNTFTHKHCYT